MSEKNKAAGGSQTIDERLAQLEAFLPLLARIDFSEVWAGQSIPMRMSRLEELVSIESPDISRAIYFGGTFLSNDVSDWVPDSIPEQERAAGEKLTQPGQLLQHRYTRRTTPSLAPK